MWTITYNGTEKSIADWGLDDLKRSRGNLGVDTVSFVAAGRFVDADELFPYGSTILIQSDREFTNNVFSGGSRWFYGRIEPWSRTGNGSREDQAGMCVGPGWYLVQRVFRQSVNSWKAWSTPGDPTFEPLYEVKTFNHVFLNQAYDLGAHPNGKLTWREQVIEALQWCITCGDPITIGEITPDFDVPIDEVKNITVAAVLEQMYRWCLDATFWWDYSTAPYPTLNCKRQPELTPASLDLNAGDRIEEFALKERTDWKRPYVLLQFEQEFNGVLQLIEDVWPNPIPAGPPPGGLETTVDLKGWSIQKLSQRIASAAYNTNDIAWWKQKLAWLADVKTISAVELVAGADGPTLLDRETGQNADSLLHYLELLPTGGAIADWMVNYSTEKVRAEGLVNVTFTNGAVKKNVRVQWDMVITNAPAGIYSTEEVSQVGDPVPLGLAKEMWTALQALGVEGEVTLTNEELQTEIGFGNCLNFITDRRPAWANVNALIQRIDETAIDGRCRITFGAPQHLTAGDLVDLLRVARNRFNPSSLNLRRGLSGSTGTTALPDKSGDGNSSSGAGQYKTHVTSGDPDGNQQAWQIKNSADEGTGGLPLISVQKVSAAGAAIPNTPSMALDFGSLPADRQVKLQPCQLAVGGVTKTVFVAATDPFSGGSGSGAQKLTLVAVWHDVLECLDAGANTVFVLKSAKLRNSIASENLDGTVYGYTYDANYVQRLSSGGGRNETQVVVPRYLTNDELWAEAIPAAQAIKIPGDNPVYVTVSLADQNRDGRAWASDNLQFQ